MNILDKMESWLGKWAAPDLPLLIVMSNAAIYVLAMIRPAFLGFLILDPDAVRAGEVWRLLTFLFVPPAMHPVWFIFWLYLLFLYAEGLEEEWGSFRFNLFYLTGAAATAYAGFYLIEGPITNVPLNTSLFLAFAALHPEFELLMFFLIPFKVKYLAVFLWIWIGWVLLTGSYYSRVLWSAALFNYLLFFGVQHFQAARFKVQVWSNRRRFQKNLRS